jgi:hypothetical protein
MVYYGLKICFKQLIQEDARILWSILLTFCSDVLDKHYTLPYFDDENLYSIITNVIQDCEEKSEPSMKALIEDVGTSITVHYFIKSIPSIPRNSTEMAVWALERASLLISRVFLAPT